MEDKEVLNTKPKALINIHETKFENQIKRNWDDFYKAFELQFRGSQEALFERLKLRYEQTLLEHCKNISQKNLGEKITALDLGCGHGEFLDLAKQLGYETQGVDQSIVAIETCELKKHKGTNSDILSFLLEQDDQSIHLISFFHVIEHCTPKMVFSICKEVYRVLKKDGLFLIETPSLLSLWASQRQFYLDPTHQHPVHPEYINFMLTYFGFANVQIKTFGEVEHPNRIKPKINSRKNAETNNILAKIDEWLFGQMDLCCLAYK